MRDNKRPTGTLVRAAVLLWLGILLLALPLAAEQPVPISNCVGDIASLLQSIKNSGGNATPDIDTALTLLAQAKISVAKLATPALKISCKLSLHATNANILRQAITAINSATDTLSHGDKNKNKDALTALSEAGIKLHSVEAAFLNDHDVDEIQIKAGDDIATASSLLEAIAQRSDLAAKLTDSRPGTTLSTDIEKANGNLSDAMDHWQKTNPEIQPSVNDACKPEEEPGNCVNRVKAIITAILPSLPSYDKSTVCIELATPIQCDLDSTQDILQSLTPKVGGASQPVNGSKPSGTQPDGGKPPGAPNKMTSALLPISLILNLITIGLLIWVYLGPLSTAARIQKQNEGILMTLEKNTKAAQDKASGLEKTVADMMAQYGEIPPLNTSTGNRSPQPGAGTSRAADKPVSGDVDSSDVVQLGGAAMPSVSVTGSVPSTPSPEPVQTKAPQPPVDPYTGKPWEDYNIARSMELAQGEEWFYRHYPQILRLSCQNLEQHRNQHVDLRFEQSSRGVFLAIQYGDDFVVFPQLIGDYASARRSLEGVFTYPSAASTNLVLKKPALVTQTSAGGFTLVKNKYGEIDIA